MYARITTLHRRDPAGSSQALAEAAGLALPRITQQPGCLGGLVLTDPVGSTLHAVTFWASAADMVDSRALGQQIAADVAKDVGASIDEIVVQVLDVAALDIDRVTQAADRGDEPFPLVRPN